MSGLTFITSQHHISFVFFFRDESDALNFTTEEKKEDKRFPEYWAELARSNLIAKMPWIDNLYLPPTHPMDYDYHIEEARQFRTYMDHNSKNESCCICGMRKRWLEFHIKYDYKKIGQIGRMDFDKIPNKDLLTVSFDNDHELGEPPSSCPRSNEFPRDAKTTYRHHDGITYCVSKHGIFKPEEGVNELVKSNVCKSCLKSLENNKIPIASFVRFDAGSYLDIDLSHPKYGLTNFLAKNVHVPHCLKPLSMYEQNLVSLYRGQRHIFILKASGGTGQWRMRGHVIAIQNVDIQDVASCFPLPFEEIPNHMQAIFISVATDKQDISKLISKASAFNVDPWNLVCWIRYLIHVYKDLLVGSKINEALITQYQNLQPGQLPDEFVDATLVAPNEDQARTLAVGFMGEQTGRQGYANTSGLPSADEMATAGINLLNTTLTDSGDGEANFYTSYINVLISHQTQMDR